MTFTSMLPRLKRKVGGKAEIKPEGNIKSIMFEDCGGIGEGEESRVRSEESEVKSTMKSITFFDL